MQTSYKISITGTSNGKNVTKTFTDISSDVTISFGTEFAASYLDLTSNTPKTVSISKVETADL